MFDSIHHVSLSVSDLNRSMTFYCDLGFSKETVRYEVKNNYIRRIVGYPDAVLNTAILTCGNTLRLELMNYIHPQGLDLDKAPPNIGSTHLCFIVEDIYAEVQRLKKKGVKFKSEVVSIDEGPNTGGYAVYFFDPDGYTMEFLSPGTNQKKTNC